MKIAALNTLILLALSFQAQAETNMINVDDWDQSLPKAQNVVVSQIQTYAYENHYTEVEQGHCGGDTAHFKLSNYYTHESYEGELQHKIKVKFLVTQSYQYCQDEVVSECEAPMTVYSDKHVSMGKTTCTVIQLP